MLGLRTCDGPEAVDEHHAEEHHPEGGDGGQQLPVEEQLAVGREGALDALTVLNQTSDESTSKSAASASKSEELDTSMELIEYSTADTTRADIVSRLAFALQS
jgi:hypothetical protein